MHIIRNLFLALALIMSVSIVGLAQDSTVDVNTATAEQLADILVGVGPAKAEAIVAYRDTHGEFQHIDELINVRGIGMSTVDRNRDRILLSGDGESPADD